MEFDHEFWLVFVHSDNLNIFGAWVTFKPRLEGLFEFG